jgi:hypothetical protein
MLPHVACIRVYDPAGNMIDEHEAAGRFQRVAIVIQIALSALVTILIGAHARQIRWRS